MGCTCREFPFPFVLETSFDEYYCLVCNASLIGKIDLNYHINSPSHNNSAQLGSPIVPIEVDNYCCKCCIHWISGFVNVHAHVKSRNHQNSIGSATEKTFGNLETITWDSCDRYAEPFVATVSENQFFCLLCDEYIYGRDFLEAHIADSIHIEAVKTYDTDISPLQHMAYHCKCCNEIIYDYRNVYCHVMGPKHQNAVYVSHMLTMIVFAPVYPQIYSFPPNIRHSHPQYPIVHFQRPMFDPYRSFPRNFVNFVHRFPYDNSAVERPANSFLEPPSRSDLFLPKAAETPEIKDEGEKTFSANSSTIGSSVDTLKTYSAFEDKLEKPLELNDQLAEVEENDVAESEKFIEKSDKDEACSSVKRIKQEDIKDETKENRYSPDYRINVPSRARTPPRLNAVSWQFSSCKKFLIEESKRNGNSVLTEVTNCELRHIQKSEIAEASQYSWVKAEKQDDIRNEPEQEDIKDETRENRYSPDYRNNSPGRTKTPPRLDVVSWQFSSCNKFLIEESKRNCNSALPEVTKCESHVQKSGIAEASQYSWVKAEKQDDIRNEPEKSPPRSNCKQYEKLNNFGKKQSKNETCREGTFEKKEKLPNNREDIYDMHDRVQEIKRGMDLCFVTLANKTYCLVCNRMAGNELINYMQHLCERQHCEYLERMVKNFAQVDLDSSQFNKLYLAYQYMEKIAKDFTRCLVCSKEVCNIDNALEEHINDDVHREKCEVMREKTRRVFENMVSRMQCNWYKIQHYECIPCSLKFDTEIVFLQHLENENHEGLENNEGGLMYDFCEPCALMWYGYRSTYDTHCATLYHKWYTHNGHFVFPELQKAAKLLLANTKKHVDATVRYLDHELSAKRRNRLITDLEKAIRFPRAKAYAFGARIPDSRLPDGDIDIFLGCENVYGGIISDKDRVSNFLGCVQKCLREHSEVWDVKNDQSPTIIKARHRETDSYCCISYEIGLVAGGERFVNFFNHFFASFRKMIIFLKQWLTYCNFGRSDDITSYALYWCVIFYLQKESILPSIGKLIATIEKPINGIQRVPDEPSKVACDKFNLEDLLIGFFTFYANFDFRNELACPLLGKAVKKKAFADPTNLPKDILPYIDNAEFAKSFMDDSPMWIQNPFDLRCNIAGGVSKACLSRFRICCSKSLLALCSPAKTP